MRNFSLLILGLLLTACPPVVRGDDDDATNDDDDATNDDDDATNDDDDGTNDDDDLVDDDDDVPVDPIILAIAPEPDEVDVFIGVQPWAQFDVAPNFVELSVVSEDGEQVLGTQSTQGTLVQLVPTSPLTPETTYEYTITWSPSTNSPLSFTFITSSAGLPVETPADLIDRTFLLDISGATFTEPPGIGAILASQLGDAELLMAATDGSDLGAGTMEILLAQGAEGEQDLAVVTTAVAGGSWTNPWVAFGPIDLLETAFVIEGVAIPLHDASFSAVFEPDLSGAVGGSLTATMDVRPLDSLLSETGEEGAACEFLSDTLGLECLECGPPDPGEFCLAVAVQDITSVALPDVTLVPVF